MKSEIDQFISERKDIKSQVIMKTVVSMLLALLLLSEIFQAVKSYQPLVVVATLMISISVLLGVLYQVTQIRITFIKRKRAEKRLDFLRKLVSQTHTSGDYSDLNYFLSKDESAYYAIELGHFLTQHFGGDWIDSDKISFPKQWGDNFLADMKRYFKDNSPEDINKISSLDIMTFLSTVKKENCEKLLLAIDK